HGRHTSHKARPNARPQPEPKNETKAHPKPAEQAGKAETAGISPGSDRQSPEERRNQRSAEATRRADATSPRHAKIQCRPGRPITRQARPAAPSRHRPVAQRFANARRGGWRARPATLAERDRRFARAYFKPLD